MRLEQFNGEKQFAAITTGNYSGVSDQSMPLAWTADYIMSEIDNTPDGEETVTCTIERDISSELSNVEINKTGVVHYYAGFNVWPNRTSTKRLT